MVTFQLLSVNVETFSPVSIAAFSLYYLWVTKRINTDWLTRDLWMSHYQHLQQILQTWFIQLFQLFACLKHFVLAQQTIKLNLSEVSVITLHVSST